MVITHCAFSEVPEVFVASSALMSVTKLPLPQSRSRRQMAKKPHWWGAAQKNSNVFALKTPHTTENLIIFEKKSLQVLREKKGFTP